MFRHGNSLILAKPLLKLHEASGTARHVAAVLADSMDSSNVLRNSETEVWSREAGTMEELRQAQDATESRVAVLENLVQRLSVSAQGGPRIVFPLNQGCPMRCV